MKTTNENNERSRPLKTELESGYLVVLRGNPAFAVQPLLRDIEYIVLDRQPTEDERGGIVPAKAQLMFKKVGGDLYLRDPDGLGPSIVSIERIEA